LSNTKQSVMKEVRIGGIESVGEVGVELGGDGEIIVQ
jgi:hypothetical protein